ncbi:MAG TPA: hypothetical protein QGF95_17220 [Candidatus Latescibacteria bacterium]|nr:hypothetical protein [Candidatus Latescibacterota bacterium]
MNGDKIRDILPLLRPRSAEPTLFSQTVWYLLWAGLAILLGLYIIRWVRLRRRRLEEFEELARDAGLSPRQIALLYRIARHRRMQSPPRLLSSAHVFDRQVGRYATGLVRGDREHPELDAIGNIREILGFDELDIDQALSSTRQVDRGQTLRIWVDGEEEDELEGFVPWREGDTEYSFVTEVIGKARTAHAVAVEHAAVKRMQHRDFYRIDVGFDADFLVIPRQAEREDGAEDVHGEAAIGLLDRTQDEDDIRIADSSAVDASTSGDELEDSDPFAGATRVTGYVVNLSAGGGVAIDVPLTGPLANEDTAWVIDPAFEGPFPLAGITCVPVSTEAAPGTHDNSMRRIKMTSDDLPTPVEKEIVRSVYEHQLQSAGGRGVAHPDAPPSSMTTICRRRSCPYSGM